MAKISYREALNQALREEMKKDPSVIVLGEEVGYYEGAYKVTQGLLAEFGDKRVLDTPIAEEIIIGAAIGAAMGGLRPVAELMTINFSLLAFDQIVNNAAKIHYMFAGQSRVPMVIRAAQGSGSQLGAQHSQQLEAYFLHCPGVRVAAPATPMDAKGLLKAAIRDDNPVIFIEGQGLYSTMGEVPPGDFTIPLGRANIVREGRDVTFISYLRMVNECLRAAEELSKDGIEAEVIDLRTLNPLDTETIYESVKKTGLALVANEAWRTGSAGAEIASLITENCFDYLDAPVIRVSAMDVPMPYNRTLEKAALPDREYIINAVKNLLRVNV